MQPAGGKGAAGATQAGQAAVPVPFPMVTDIAQLSQIRWALVEGPC